MTGPAGRPLSRIAVVGASLAGVEAASALRRLGFDGDLAIFGAERHRPYDRPPLSKELLLGVAQPSDLTLSTADISGVEWRLGERVVAFDAVHRRLSLVDERQEAFDGIVIATGAEAIRPAFTRARDLAGVHFLRSLDDSLSLAEDLRGGPTRVAIVGAGFVGAEIASACYMLGIPTTVIEGLATPFQLPLGRAMGSLMAQQLRDHSVVLRTGVPVRRLLGSDRVAGVVLADDSVIAADLVIVSVGVRPAVEWLRDSGLTLDDGVLCDETCLAAPGVVAAGDVARWPNSRFGETRRIEHWDNAIRQGLHAATRLLAGDDAVGEPYRPVPWFWTDQFGSKLQLAGSTLGYDEFMIVDGTVESRRLVGAYRRGDRLVAGVALNSAKKFLELRRVIEQGVSWNEYVSALRTERDVDEFSQR